jgi:hypothetical protein
VNVGFKLFVAAVLLAGFLMGVPVGFVLYYFFFDIPCPWLP